MSRRVSFDDRPADGIVVVQRWNLATGSVGVRGSRQWRLAVPVAALAMAVLPLACSDDSPATADDTPSTTSTTAATPSTTQPDASDEAAVQPHIEDLLADWDEQMTAIIEDPSPVAADPEHPLAAELAAGFTDDSPFIEDLPVYLNDVHIARDIGVRPGSDGLSRRTRLTHFTDASADEPDFVSFVFCLEHDGEGFRLSSGEDLAMHLEITIGAGRALRVDGRWLLHELFQLGNLPDAGSTGDRCTDVATEGGT